jgi:hypothetical protein
MAPDERSRVEATQALADQVGAAAAAALMECIPPFGWHAIATKHDLSGGLASLEERMTLRMDAMEARLDAKLARLDGRIDTAVSAQNRALVLVVAGAVLASAVTNLLT